MLDGARPGLLVSVNVWCATVVRVNVWESQDRAVCHSCALLWQAKTTYQSKGDFN